MSIKRGAGTMPAIRFKARLHKIGTWTLLTLPGSASAKLPSRGMVMVEGTVNDRRFRAALEPDGKGSHWFRVDKIMRGAGAEAGDTVSVAIGLVGEWPEPEVPPDLKDALNATPQMRSLWMDITPMARWDWIRWIGATGKPETRKRRIEKTCSMLGAGKRRPCCFNRNQCTEPYVSNNGVLVDSIQTTEKKRARK